MNIAVDAKILARAVCGIPSSAVRLWRAARAGDGDAALRLRIRAGVVFFMLFGAALVRGALGLLPVGGNPLATVRFVGAAFALVGFAVYWFGLLALMVGTGKDEDISDAVGLAVVTAALMLATIAFA